MEMDSWQYWDSVRKDALSGKLGISCKNCDFTRDIIINKDNVLSIKKTEATNKTNPNRDFDFICPKCKRNLRFYLKK